MPRGRAGKQVRRPRFLTEALQNGDVMSLFGGALGKEGVSPALAWVKFRRITHHTGRYLKLLRLLGGGSFLRRDDCADLRQEVADYVEGLAADHEAGFGAAPDLAAWIPPTSRKVVEATPPDELDAVFGPDFGRVPPGLRQTFEGLYAAANDRRIVSDILETCTNLQQAARSLKDPERLSDRFLRGAGTVYAPVAGLPGLDFKSLYGLCTPPEKHYLLRLLHKLYAVSHDLYRAFCTPDIDVEEFKRIVSESLGEVRKRLPRCDKALEQIRRSLDTLDEKFGDYYKDYLSSNNPSTMMESFVLDVSKNIQTDAETGRQFRDLISFYRENSKKARDADPRLRAVLDQADSSFLKMEERMRKAEQSQPSPSGGEEADAGSEDDEDDDGEDADEVEGLSPSGGEHDGGVATGERGLCIVQDSDEDAFVVSSGAPPGPS